jgi:lipopolysaccharide biosynthesis protein
MNICNRQLYLAHSRFVYNEFGEYYKYPPQFVDYSNQKTTNPQNICPIAFYLPQFYPTSVNDENWGRGFTEWTNVSRAKPAFIHHYQPHIPERFGFYDIRLTDILEQQAQLSLDYGIKAFCFYFYCFSGQTQLEEPLAAYSQNRNISQSFCICWANENWTRKWDGKDNHVLLKQDYDTKNIAFFINKINSYFNNEKYLRINNKPLLLIYNPGNIPNITSILADIRRLCCKNGNGEIMILAANTFKYTYEMAMKDGFDAFLQFPPHGIKTVPINIRDKIINPYFNGKIYDIREYIAVVEEYLQKPIYPGVFPSWDNTARCPETAKIFINTTPAIFKEWLHKAIKSLCEHFSSGQRLLFVNAWNEWSEGAHMEPDRYYGYAFLQALRESIEEAKND